MQVDLDKMEKAKTKVHIRKLLDKIESLEAQAKDDREEIERSYFAGLKKGRQQAAELGPPTFY